MARNLLETGQTDPAIYRHSFPSQYGWAGIWTWLMAFWLSLGEYSFALGRAFIFVAGGISVALLAVAAYRLYDALTAWLVILIGTAVVLRLDYIRPDMLAALYLSLAILFFSLGQQAGRWWAHLLAGVMAGLSVDAAPLAYSCGVGFALFYLGEYIGYWRQHRKLWWLPFWALIAGGAIGLGIYLFTRQGTTFPWEGGESTGSMLGGYLTAIQARLGDGTLASVISDFAVNITSTVPVLFPGLMLGIGAAVRVRNRVDRLLLTMLTVWLTIIVLTYHYFPPFYLLHGLPVLVLLAARGFARGLPMLLGIRLPVYPSSAFVLWLSMLLVTWFVADVFVIGRQTAKQDIVAIAQEIGDILPEETVIVAAESYYFGLLDHPEFVGGAIEGQLTTYQGLSPREAWETISPDAIVLSETWPEPPRTEGLLAYLTDQGFTLLRDFQTSSYGRVELWVREGLLNRPPGE